MPTIKTKKEMNLPELIEWGWKNEIKKRSFISNDGKVTANFEDMGRFIADNFISSDVTFTVEIEKEITESTKIPELLEVYLYNRTHEKLVVLHENKSINEVIAKENFTVDSFYILNEKEWNRLKQRVITDYITLSREEENADNVKTLAGEILRLEKVGEDMDWLDDTCEFSNILHDMNRSE